ACRFESCHPYQLFLFRDMMLMISHSGTFPTKRPNFHPISHSGTFPTKRPNFRRISPSGTFPTKRPNFR
ncbi:MAG: hypothetical protein Q8881_03015, partial [Sweet potato little leaf phytoplasma]|nr:hypothetical protein [Sweet potato little leaf phytoplasma]